MTRITKITLALIAVAVCVAFSTPAANTTSVMRGDRSSWS